MRTYHWKHIPTGNEGTGEFSEELIPSFYANARLRTQALELINQWNRVGRGAWLYWMD
jgi:hypothetical protein